jgi:type I restriction enzyme S subunit
LSLIDERITTQNKIIERLETLIKGIRNEIFGKLRKSIGFNAIVGDVLQYEQPQSYIVEDTEYTKEGTPVLTANKAFILGYTSEVDGIYDKGNCIIFDDFTLDCKYVDFPFKVKSSAIKILTAKSNELLRYVYEFLKYLDLSTEEHKRHYIAETQNQGFILSSAKTVEMISHTFSALSLRLSSTVQLRNKYEAQKQHLLRQMFI